MIIESGWDLLTLAKPRLLEGPVDAAPRAVVVCDPDLRLIDLCFVGPDALPGEVMREIAERQSRREEDGLGEYCTTAFVATVQRSDQLPPAGDCERWKSWTAAIESHGWMSLGQVELDDERWQSSGPMYEFKSYGGEFPRALVVRGPHDYDCSCVVCATDRDRIARLRAMNVQKNVQ